MSDGQCANRSGFGHTCVRNPEHDGPHGYAGMFWDDARAAEMELEELKTAVLELARAYLDPADKRDFSDGYRDGCRIAGRDFRYLIENWDEILANTLSERDAA